MDDPLTDLEAISLAPRAASRRIDRGDRAANRCAEGLRITYLEATLLINKRYLPQTGGQQLLTRSSGV